MSEANCAPIPGGRSELRPKTLNLEAQEVVDRAAQLEAQMAALQAAVEASQGQLDARAQQLADAAQVQARIASLEREKRAMQARGLGCKYL